MVLPATLLEPCATTANTWTVAAASTQIDLLPVLSSRHCASRHDPPRGGVTMRKPTAIGLAALLLGLGALLAAPLSAGAQDEVKLGAFLPISGISADVGAQMK